MPGSAADGGGAADDVGGDDDASIADGPDLPRVSRRATITATRSATTISRTTTVRFPDRCGGNPDAAGGVGVGGVGIEASLSDVERDVARPPGVSTCDPSTIRNTLGRRDRNIGPSAGILVSVPSRGCGRERAGSADGPRVEGDAGLTPVVQRFRLVSRFVVGRVLRWGGRARSGCWPVVGVGPWPGVLVPPAASRLCPRDEAAARPAPGPAAAAGPSRVGGGGSVRGGGGGGSVGWRPA